MIGYATKSESQSDSTKHTKTNTGRQNEETKKYGQNVRTEQNSRKRTRRNGDKQHIRTLVIRILKELIGYFNSI